VPGLNLEGEELAPTIDNRRRGEEEPTLTIDDESSTKTRNWSSQIISRTTASTMAQNT